MATAFPDLFVRPTFAQALIARPIPFASTDQRANAHQDSPVSFITLFSHSYKVGSRGSFVEAEGKVSDDS